MVEPKAKKKAPAPPKAESKVRALKAKKAVLKDIHTHVTRLLVPQDPESREVGLIRLKEQAQEEQGCPLCHHKIPPPSLTQPRRRQHTCAHCDVKVNKYQIKQAVKKL